MFTEVCVRNNNNKTISLKAQYCILALALEISSVHCTTKVSTPLADSPALLCKVRIVSGVAGRYFLFSRTNSFSSLCNSNSVWHITGIFCHRWVGPVPAQGKWGDACVQACSAFSSMFLWIKWKWDSHASMGGDMFMAKELFPSLLGSGFVYFSHINTSDTFASICCISDLLITVLFTDRGTVAVVP